LSNAFLVSTGAALAITYNDRSPLENMHAAKFFETLHRPGHDFLKNLPGDANKAVRSKVIDAILATDMGHHFEIVDKLIARVSKKGDFPVTKTFSTVEHVDSTKDEVSKRSNKDDRRMLLQVFMHTSDLGHCCRPWDVHKGLVVDLEEEFFRQGDRERDLGVPVMPMMDRTKDSAAAGQGFFLEKLVCPLLEPFCQFIDPGLGQFFQDNLADNKQRWCELVETHGKQTAAKLVPLDGGTVSAPPTTYR